MAKKVIIDVEVNSSQIDQAVAKTGQLKELSKGLKIQYDVDGKPLDVVLDKTLNLQKQFKLLTAELKRTKEGTDEYYLLSTRLGDVKDGLDRVKAKSGDLLTSLQLLPGPVGEFASKLNGGIALMKTLTSFSFKDIIFQLREVSNDVKDVISNLLGLGNAAVQTSQSLAEVGETAAKTANTVATDANTGAETLNSKARLQNLATVKANITALDIETFAKANNVKITDVMLNANGELVTKSQLAADAATKSGQAFANSGKAAEGATAAIKRFFASLSGFQWGAIIAAIALLGYKLYQFVTATTAAEEAALSFKEGLKKGAETSADAANKIAQVGIAFEEARKKTISKKDALDEYNKVLGGTIGEAKTLEEAEKLYNANTENYIKATGLRAEAQELYAIAAKKSAEALTAEEVGFWSFDRGLFQTYDAELKQRKDKLIGTADLIKTKANQLTAEALKLETGYKPKTEAKVATTTKENEDKQLLERQKELSQQLLSLAQEDERKKAYIELEGQRDKEKRDVEALKISKKYETVRTTILLQIQEEFELKKKALDKKYKEEDIKLNQDFVNKLADISIAAEKDEVERNIWAREEKYKRDRDELEKDKLFIKSSEETKAFYREQLIIAKEQDIAKIRLEAKIKAYQDELMLLEAQQKSLTAGTDAYLANAIAIENTAYQIKLANAKDNAKQIEAVNKEHAANLKAIDLASFEAKKQIEIQRYQVVATIGQSLQALAGKQKGIAIAGVVVEKAAAIGQIWANNAIANAKATAVSPLTFGQPWVTVNTVSAVLSTAATVAAAAKAISEINNPSGGSGDSGAAAQQPATPNYGRNYADGGMIGGKRHYEGGTMIEAERGEAIMTRGAVTMFQPMLSMMNQMGGGTGFAPSLVSTSYDNPKLSTPSQDEKPMIIKSYVVAGELTSEANKQARLKDLSTL